MQKNYFFGFGFCLLSLLSCSDPGERTLAFDQNGIYANSESSSSSDGKNSSSSSSENKASSSSDAVDDIVIVSSSSSNTSSSSYAIPDVTASFVSAGYTLGGATSVTPSCLDLDGGILYSSTQLTSTPASKSLIDVIFSGSAIITPQGTSEQNYMVAHFSGIDNDASLMPITAQQKAQLTAEDATVGMLSEMIDPNQLVFSATLSEGDAFIVITDQSAPIVIIAESLDTSLQKLTLKVLREAE